MYEIYVIGSMELMQSVLNAVAAMTANGAVAGNGNMIALGLTFSVLFVVTKAIITQKLEIQYFFISLVLYLVMFAPKVTVQLEDVSTGAVVNIANVPVGVAGIGSIASSVGTSLSRAYETLFSVPGITDGGYITPLKILAAARNPTLGNANTLGPVPSGGTSVNVAKSVNNYMIDCAYQDMFAELPAQDVTEANMKAATVATIWNSLKVNSASWFTVTYLTNGFPSGTLQTCSDAWASLDTALTLHSALSVDYMGKNNGDPTFTVTADNAIATLTGTSVTMQNFMKTTFIRNIAENAKAGYFIRAGDVAMSSMLTQAKTQRQIQWAAEKDMFEEVAKPLIAAIEAFFYAISPIMIFFVLLGSFGWGLFLKYIIMAIWIQLWMPILAVNNHYIVISVQKAFTNLSATGLDFTTHDGMNETWDTLATWTATGGMLAAATPLMALMVITGSFYAFTKLTDRMNGGDHVDEKQMAPDLQRPAPLVAMGSQMQVAPHQTQTTQGGTVASGANMPSYNFSTGTTNSTASAKKSMNSASLANTKAFGTTFGHNVSSGGGSISSQGEAYTYGNDNSVTDTATTQIVESITAGSTATQAQKRQLKGIAGIQSSGSWKKSRKRKSPEDENDEMLSVLGTAMAAMGITGGVDKSWTNESGVSNLQSHLDAKQASTGRSISERYTDSRMQDLRNGETNFFNEGMSNDDKKTLQQSSSTMQQATNEFAFQSTHSSGAIRTQSRTFDNVAQTMVDEPNSPMTRELHQLLDANHLNADGGLNAALNTREARAIGQDNSRQRLEGGVLVALANAGGSVAEQAQAIVGKYSGFDGFENTSESNKGVASDVPDAKALNAEVQDGIPAESTFTAASEANQRAAFSGRQKGQEDTFNENMENRTMPGDSPVDGVRDAITEAKLDGLEFDTNNMGAVQDTVSKFRSVEDLKNGYMDSEATTSKYTQEGRNAGLSQDAAELHGLYATERNRSALMEGADYVMEMYGSYTGTDVGGEVTAEKERIAELEGSMDPRAAAYLQHVSHLDEDVRGMKLDALSRIKGYGARGE